MDTFPPHGSRVRFTSSALGTIDPAQPGAKFQPEMVGADDTGEVVTTEGQMPHGWLAVRPDKYPTLLVPAHPSMIEPEEAAR